MAGNVIITNANGNKVTLQNPDTNLSDIVVDTSAIVNSIRNQTIAGVKRFSSSPIVPTPTDGEQAANKAYVDSAVGGVNTITKTGEAIFNSTTQQITLTGIGLLDFQIGDVIEVTGSASNNKLFTVEGKGSNYLTVNYEHRGSSTKGRLINETASNCTIKLYNRAKNAPLGQGQYWIDVTTSRNVATTYTNNTGRPIQIFITFDPLSTGPHFYIDNINILPNNDTGFYHVTCIVPANSTYQLVKASTGVQLTWAELR